MSTPPLLSTEALITQTNMHTYKPCPITVHVDNCLDVFGWNGPPLSLNASCFSSARQILIRPSLPYSAISTSGNLSDLFQLGIDVPSSDPLSKSLSRRVSPAMAEIRMFFPQHCHDQLRVRNFPCAWFWPVARARHRCWLLISFQNKCIWVCTVRSTNLEGKILWKA